MTKINRLLYLFIILLFKKNKQREDYEYDKQAC